MQYIGNGSLQADNVNNVIRRLISMLKPNTCKYSLEHDKSLINQRAQAPNYIDEVKFLSDYVLLKKSRPFPF